MFIQALLVVSQSYVQVLLPGATTPEYYKAINGQQLPRCAGSEWKVQGSTYDGTTVCTTDARVKLRVNPFRCSKFALWPSLDGIFDCLTCNYGFSASSTTSEIFVYQKANQAATNWFVSKGYSPYNPRTNSCIMTSDPNLAKLCNNIQDQVQGTIHTKSYCMRSNYRGSGIPFRSTPFTELDSTSCNVFAISNYQVVCQQ